MASMDQSSSAPPPPHLPVQSRARKSDAVRQTELIISYVLRGGVFLSAGIILVGVIAFYARYGTVASRVSADRVFPHTLPSVLSGLASGSPLAIVTLGLLVLLVTPVLRVLVSIFAFAVERDWRYTTITCIVLFILLVSFFLGKVGA
jgi:uncharacterized membrane protein